MRFIASLALLLALALTACQEKAPRPAPPPADVQARGQIERPDTDVAPPPARQPGEATSANPFDDETDTAADQSPPADAMAAAPAVTPAPAEEPQEPKIVESIGRAFFDALVDPAPPAESAAPPATEAPLP